MNFELFIDDEYVIQSSKELKRSDVVYLTTSRFPFDASNGEFTNDEMYTYVVKLTIVNEDLSDFVHDKATDGGRYGYAKGVVTEIISKD